MSSVLVFHKGELMKRGFIRGLWGSFDVTNRLTARRFNVANDILNIKRNEFNEKFVTYIMGVENFKILNDLGIENLVLVDKEPFRFDLTAHQYRNKIEVIAHAFLNDGYGELVYLDWDCVPQKKLSNDFWTELGKRECFQANLQGYKKNKISWRQSENNIIPNGGFMYLRDKKISELAIKTWDKIGNPVNDECVWASITDDMVGGWKGREKYMDLFESMYSNLHRGSPFPREWLNKKDVYFIHYQGGRTRIPADFVNPKK